MQEPPQKIGRYSIIRELGRGGMGVVFLGLDEKLEREVALKVIANLTDSSERRFSFEGQLLAKLNHPNVVQLFDVVEEPEHTALVMEYVEGNTLGQRLNMQPSRAVKLKWLKEVSDGLAAAHHQGIAHCDLKPENVLIDKHNVAKIADFGIAKQSSRPTTDVDSSETVTASYTSLSPEMLAGLPTDEKTDLFALGNLIHQTLTGTHAFGDHKDQNAFIKRIQNGAHALDTQSRDVLGNRLFDLLENLIQVEPRERIYTASEVAAVLESELQYSQSSVEEDLTVEIPVQPTPSSKPKSLLSFNLIKSASLVLLGFLVGALIFKAWVTFNSSNESHTYVAMMPYEIEFDETVTIGQKALLGATINDSINQAILNVEHTSLVPESEIRNIEQSAQEIARVTSANEVLKIDTRCSSTLCTLKLSRYSGSHMGMTDQKSWPVSTQSLLGIRDSIFQEVAQIFNSSLPESNEITESNYQKYVQIVERTEFGRQPDYETLTELRDLTRDQPTFFPAYNLARRFGERLYAKNSETNYIQVLKGIYSNIPSRYQEHPVYLGGLFSLALISQDYGEAEKKLESARVVFEDPLRVMELETDLAYYSGDTNGLLRLDRRAALLRPSAKNLYNLATSEYTVGNFELAKKSVEGALDLYPNYSFALTLRGTIAKEEGNLNDAVRFYNEAIKIRSSGSNLNNLGLTHLLMGDVSKAQSLIQQALALAPSRALYNLNIADTYKLQGDSDKAIASYEKVLEITKNLERSSDYWLRVQALAQLGKHSEAIRLLNEGVTKYPDSTTLLYSAALAHSLADNKIAAVVAVEEAIKRGTGKVWFRLPWFRSLCGNKTFEQLLEKEADSLCN